MTPRDYAKILPSFWTGSTGRAIRKLGPWSQVVAMYLLSSPHANAIGLYHLPLAYLCADTGCPFDGASEVLRSLSGVGFAHYDEDTETVWIPEMARHQIGESIKPGDKRVAWVAKLAESVRNRPFFSHFIAKYAVAYNLAAKGHGSPFDAPSMPLRCQEQEQEQDQQQEQEPSRAAAREAPPAPPRNVPRHVEAFERSLAAPTDVESEVVALVSETRKAAGGAPFRPTGWHDREAVQRLAEWSAAPDIGPERLRAALAAFWSTKGTGARLTYLVEEDPGRFLGEVRGRRQHVARAASQQEHAAAVAAAGGEGYAVVQV